MDERPLEVIEREITELAAHINAATCRWLLLVAEFDRRLGWAEWGCKSCAHWLNWRCAISLATARDQIRVAHALDGLAHIRDAFSEGRVSYSKVRALVRVATAENEEVLLETSRHLSASQLERVVRGMRQGWKQNVSPRRGLPDVNVRHGISVGAGTRMAVSSSPAGSPRRTVLPS